MDACKEALTDALVPLSRNWGVEVWGRHLNSFLILLRSVNSIQKITKIMGVQDLKIFFGE